MTIGRARTVLTALTALAVLALAPMPGVGSRTGASVAARPYAPEGPLAESLTVSLLAELAPEAPDQRGPAPLPVQSAHSHGRLVPTPSTALPGRDLHVSLRFKGFRARPTRAPPVLSI